MNQEQFEDYLHTQSQTDQTEAVGRFITNAFGVQERVVLPASYWRYAHWLELKYGFDLAAYYVECDKERTDWTLSETIMYWLHRDLRDREERGEYLPGPAELDQLPLKA